jgi:hypothetical protein
MNCLLVKEPVNRGGQRLIRSWAFGKRSAIRVAVEDGIISMDDADWPLMRDLGRYWSTRCSEYAQSKLFDERFFNYLKVGITLPPMKTG